MPRGPWCPEHRCHPNDCFEIHYPESTRGEPVDYKAIIRRHAERQNELIREQQAKKIVDAREKFRRRRGA